MDSDEIKLYENLPDDPEQAFLAVEDFFRTRLENKLSFLSQDERGDLYYVQYISKVIAAAKELGLASAVSERSAPSYQDIDYNAYADFSKDVEAYRTSLQIRLGRRTKQYSVKLDASGKQRLRKLLHEAKEIVDVLEVDQRKKEALYIRIRALEAEIDRDRTRFEAVGALFVDVCELAGQGAEKLEPLVKVVERIGKAVGIAKSAENHEQPRLPHYEAPRQIEPPRNPAPSVDDDIPF